MKVLLILTLLVPSAVCKAIGSDRDICEKEVELFHQCEQFNIENNNNASIGSSNETLSFRENDLKANEHLKRLLECTREHTCFPDKFARFVLESIISTREVLFGDSFQCVEKTGRHLELYKCYFPVGLYQKEGFENYRARPCVEKFLSDDVECNENDAHDFLKAASIIDRLYSTVAEKSRAEKLELE